MEGISNEYIKNAIDELVDSLGIKEDIPIESVVRPLRNGKTKECIENIANYLGLPITVNLTISDRFETRALAATSSAGQGVQGITAQVSIPSNLPFYGTPSVHNIPVQVQVSGGYQQSAHTFVAIMAHELSHLVLHSLWHREKNNEVYTDLAAMILGFSDVINSGRRVVKTQYYDTFSQTSTMTYGYLADEQFNFALNYVMRILKDKRSRWEDTKQQTIQTLAAYKKQVHLYRKTLYELNKLIEYLDRKATTRKIRKEDVPKVVGIHSPGYLERFSSVLTNNERKLKEVESLYSERFQSPHQHYTTHRLDSLRIFYENLNALVSSVTSEFNLLKDDVAVLRRCVGFWGRLNVR